MKKIIGIRREDKNEWERRVPIIPEDLAELSEKYGIEAVVQPSANRIYTDEVYKKDGAILNENFENVNTVFAVKEIPTQLLETEKTYIFFSHTIKGQDYNMDMLRQLMALKCNLIDYERIVNEKGQRLIFFGAHAGYAGMFETLVAYAKKLQLNGIDSPLAKIKQAYEYASLEEAKQHIKEIGKEISDKGLPEAICPLIVGFTGYGQVSGGAQEILDILPVKEITPDQIENIRKESTADRHHIYKVVFKEQDMVKPLSGEFELQDYYNSPEQYQSVMENYLPSIDILVNCIYWTPKYPRIISKSWLKEQAAAGKSLKLKVIGDISCDIEGAIEITYDATMPDKPCFTYFPESDSFKDEITADGFTVMAIDNLPCEFSKEASMSFSKVLKTFVADIVDADFSKPFDELDLPYPIKKALILHQGQLTKEYKYMEEFIK
jgi:saccharopine dehydrogenase (NAD+, L-lysine forming)